MALIRWQWRQEVLPVIQNLRGTWVDKQIFEKGCVENEKSDRQTSIVPPARRTVGSLILIFVLQHLPGYRFMYKV